MENKVTKDMLIGEVVSKYPETIEILMGAGMHCLGCPSSQMESLSDACAVHGISSDALLAAITKSYQNKTKTAVNEQQFFIFLHG